jgi:hypothetical protein
MNDSPTCEKDQIHLFKKGLNEDLKNSTRVDPTTGAAWQSIDALVTYTVAIATPTVTKQYGRHQHAQVAEVTKNPTDKSISSAKQKNKSFKKRGSCSQDRDKGGPSSERTKDKGKKKYSCEERRAYQQRKQEQRSEADCRICKGSSGAHASWCQNHPSKQK